MASVNKVILVGSIGRDIESRYSMSDVLASYMRICRSSRAWRHSREAQRTSVGETANDVSFSRADSNGGLPVMFQEMLGRKAGDRRDLLSRLNAPCSDAGRMQSFFGSSKANKRNAP